MNWLCLQNQAKGTFFLSLIKFGVGGTHTFIAQSWKWQEVPFSSPILFLKGFFLNWHIQISPLFSFTEMWAWLYYIWLRSKGWGFKWCWCFYGHTHNPTSHESESCSVVSESLWPHGLYSLWNSPGQITGVGSPSLLQGIFPTQGLNPGLPHCRRILYQLSHKGSPRILSWSPSNSTLNSLSSVFSAPFLLSLP